MLDLSRGRLAIKYMLFELLPVFLMGVTVFIFVLLMFQSFRLSEYIIVNGAKYDAIAKLIFYVMLGYLPILFPIALLFAVLLTYGRMSGDSEIVAFKALGLTPAHLLIPALILGLSVSILSLQTSFRLAPWGNRNLDELLSRLAQTQPGISIREGVFSEGFFDLVVYANRVDSKDGTLKKVFIYDERDAEAPLTIIAREGQLVNQNTQEASEGFLRLNNGSVHKSQGEFYTKIDFNTYDINLFDAHEIKESKASPSALNYYELRDAIKNQQIKPKEKMNLLLEWHSRWALSATCFIFSLIGVGLGTVTNRRVARSSSLVISISAIVIYWSLYVAFESLARSGHIPPSIGAWITNILFLIFGLFQFRKISQS